MIPTHLKLSHQSRCRVAACLPPGPPASFSSYSHVDGMPLGQSPTLLTVLNRPSPRPVRSRQAHHPARP
jgi:hypothetical protein